MSYPIVWVELSSKDRETDTKFYSDVFGWEISRDENMDYTMFSAGEGPGGGFSPVGENVAAGDVLVYLDTEDIDATLAKIEKSGGEIVAPVMEIPTVGKIAIFSDPTGNRLALLESAGES